METIGQTELSPMREAELARLNAALDLNHAEERILASGGVLDSYSRTASFYPGEPVIAPRPVFEDREDAVLYLQSCKHRAHSPLRSTAACGKKGTPDRSIIAEVDCGNGRSEVLHATKGWRRRKVWN